jgi:hypothetical protein
MRLTAPLLALATFLWSTPPLCGQPVTDAERDRIVRDLIRLNQARPSDPIFYQSTTTTQSAQGVGASLRGAGDKADISGFNASAPSAGLGPDGPAASGGSTKASVSAARMLSFWFIAGLVLMGLGVYFDFFYTDPATGKKGNDREALAFFAAGAALIVVAFVPGWLWACLGIGGAALLAGYLWLSFTAPAAASRFREAARATLSAIEAAPAEASAAVKDSLARAPDVTATDRATLLSLKHADFPDRVGL